MNNIAIHALGCLKFKVLGKDILIISSVSYICKAELKNNQYIGSFISFFK